MKLLLIFLIIIYFISISCSKKTNDNNQIFQDNSKIEQLVTPHQKTTEFNSTKPIPYEELSQIFPKNISELQLEKINKGTINYTGLIINSASAEYSSHNGLILVYVYDYLNFSNLPNHLKSIFEISTKSDIFSIENGLGRFSLDEISHSNYLDLVYLKRFHIKIESINYPNFQDEAKHILSSLYLNRLLKSVKVGKNGTF